MINNLSDKYTSNDIGKHWEISEDPLSFRRLLNHLNFSTKNYEFFSIAINRALTNSKNKDLIVVDLGAGIGWTSAIMSFDPRIKKIYVIEPTQKRIDQIKDVFKHFKCDISKLEVIKSTFTTFKIQEKIDLFVLHGSFHHCYNEDLKNMFNNIKIHLSHNSEYKFKDFLNRDISLPINSKVLISGEHYLNRYIFLWRIIKKIILKTKNKNDVDNFSGEHNRYEKEIKKIFIKNKFNYQIFNMKGDMIDPMLLKKNIIKKIFYRFNIQALYYYYCILELKK